MASTSSGQNSWFSRVFSVAAFLPRLGYGSKHLVNAKGGHGWLTTIGKLRDY